MHAETQWQWKGFGVGEEELAKNYMYLVVAPQMGQGIMPNTVGEFRY